MGKKLYEESNISAIANSIREKNGSETTYKVSEMPQAILNIPDKWKQFAINMIDYPVNQYGNPDFEYPTGDKLITELPDGITQISIAAFAYNSNLALTSLPEGIKSIGTRAFFFCPQLALTTLPESLNEMTEIPDQCFSYCSKLALTKLPSGITTIGDNAFESCEALDIKELPNPMKEIGEYAFSMTRVAFDYIPLEKFANIYASAFEEAEFVSDSLTIGNSNVSIGQDAFLACYNLKTVTFEPGDLKPNFINGQAFHFCFNIKTINVPWAEGAVANAPWGATNATINYNYTGE